MQIQISGQYGDPQAWDVFVPLQRQLNACFDCHVTGSYLRSITKFAIAFRVSGTVQDFGSEGPERIKLLCRQHILTMDMVYACQPWKTIDRNALVPVVSADMATCIGMMIERARRAGEVLQHEQLRIDAASALAEFERHFLGKAV
ncbi:hypothetical protein I5U23_09340 [Stenotrophomonas maltophilia]|uniref:Uncharacterized protein n=1 Tax=Stenotrophomonas riyadhensis TaxID=2859893 RepID=A0ABT2XJL3_9GAMM|nr:MULTISPECIES: hypothetical protein [Stenotrophomonas]MBH1618117.1 hypothetical protein [Stenotrophomonas maltophilia]MCV0325238.1 hypothetical protein [Stenotrophomonas sp. CFS3442]HEL4243459.1 hypothetical protein [Stenotrophomonas maltophilia]